MKLKFEDKFYTITGILNIPDGVYSANPITGKVKNNKTGKILKGHVSGFGHISISVQKKHIFVHKLLAQFFLGIPSDPLKTIVHHKNSNPRDNRLENLEWLTVKEHSKAHKGRKCLRSSIYYIKLDDQRKEVERIDLVDLKNEVQRRRIQKAASQGNKTEGFYWKVGDKRIDEYMEKYGMPKDSDWKPCPNCPGWFCTKYGLFKSPSGTLTLGYIIHDGYCNIRIKIETKGHTIKTHRVIWETFNRPLMAGEEIDHVDGNKQNNSLFNLRVTDHKGNINNPITIERHKKARRNDVKNVEQYTFSGELIKTYSCAKDAADDCRIKDQSNILKCCKGIRVFSAKSLWCFEGENNKIKADQEKLLFKYDQSGNLLKVYIGPADAEKDTTISKWTIAKYAKSGKPAPDNYYYYKGPKKIINKVNEENQIFLWK